MLSSFRTAALLFLGVSISTGCGGNDATPPQDPVIEAPKLASRRLVTQGGAFIDVLGRKVILRGLNVGGRSKMPPFVPFDIASDAEIPAKADQIMAAVRRLGSNGVRMILSWEALEPQRGTFDGDYVARYRALLDAADRAGLSVIVDFHQDVFQAAFCGDGFPEWALGDIPHGPPHYDCGALGWSLPYFNPLSEVSRAFDGLWSNRDGVLDAFVGMWTHVAREIGRHPAVAAFEVMNEPGAGSQPIATIGGTVLPALHDRVAAAIEAEAGPAAVLSDEPIAIFNNVGHLARPAHTHFVYGPHFYDALTSLGSPLDADRIRTELAAIVARAEPWGAPVVVGEYGASNTYPERAEYASAVLDVADASRASAMAWEASMSDVFWNAEDFSALTTDGTELAWGAALDRPVPRAIDGTILELGWDAAAKRFALSVEAQGDNVSEVYLPVRYMGAAPKITVSGARHRWMQESGVVLILAERGASWSLVAEAEPPP
jgi:endoglycosylceramidase